MVSPCAFGTIGVSEDGSFTYSGEMTFTGTVQGCGSGTVFFDVAGEGTTDADGVSTFTSNTATPGGSLHLVATIDESGTEDRQGDGTTIMEHTARRTRSG